MLPTIFILKLYIYIYIYMYMLKMGAMCCSVAGAPEILKIR